MFYPSMGTPMMSKSLKPSRPIRTPNFYLFLFGATYSSPLHNFQSQSGSWIICGLLRIFDLFSGYMLKHYESKIFIGQIIIKTHLCGMSPLKQYFLQLCLVCMATIMSGFHRNCFRRQGTKSILSFSCLIWWGDLSAQ